MAFSPIRFIDKDKDKALLQHCASELMVILKKIIYQNTTIQV